MSKESKIQIFKACVRPGLTYSSKTRAETSNTKRSTEMKVLRTIRGIILSDRIGNKVRVMEVQNMVRWTWELQVKSHVQRMNSKDYLADLLRDGIRAGHWNHKS